MRGTRWVLASGDNGCWLGTYEVEKQRSFLAVLPDKKVVFDIGANVGFYSLLSAAVLRDQGRIFAFEPLPRNLQYLRRHIAINKRESIEVIDLALADISGTETFQLAASHAMGRLSSEGSVSVRVETLDALHDRGVLPDPDLMKIDVEGAEFRVLRGAVRMLRRANPVIFLSVHSERLRLDCTAFLHALGYDVADTGVNGEQLPGGELIARRCRG